MKKFLLLSIFLFLGITSKAQDCPSSYTNNGGRIKFTWSGVKPTGITDVTWTDGNNYPGADQTTTTWRTTSTAIAPTGTESGTIIFTYSGGTYHCDITAGALPIELMYFNGEQVNGTTVLKWATASETNNSHFTIERSTDNVNWTVVGVKNGAGNSINILNYEMTDYTLATGTIYYRLRQDDYNGDYTYSNTIAITANNNTKLKIMGLYVENNNLKVSVEGNTSSEPITVQINSLMGTIEKTETFAINDINSNIVNLDVSALAGGVYTITVTQGNQQSTGKFIR